MGCFIAWSLQMNWMHVPLSPGSLCSDCPTVPRTTTIKISKGKEIVHLDAFVSVYQGLIADVNMISQ